MTKKDSNVNILFLSRKENSSGFHKIVFVDKVNIFSPTAFLLRIKTKPASTM